jgi:4-amino-4-deoxy-L-arabinose transferase-like glycosyltransferase
LRALTSARSSAAAVLLVIALATLLRLPLLSWPLAVDAKAACCGHPDEIQHYDLIRQFRSGVDSGSYPPGLAVLTSLVLHTPARNAFRSFAPAGIRGDERDRIQVVSIGRILGLFFSGLAVWLLYRLGVGVGLEASIAAASAPMLALAPLFSVQSTYALADVPQVALILACILAFLLWDRERRPISEALFGFLLGAIFAFKLVGVVVALPPLLSMMVRSRSRLRTIALIGLSFLAGLLAFSAGFLRFALPLSIFHKVVVENARASRIHAGWNAVHHLLSLVPGMGAPFVLLLIVAIVGFGFRAFRRRDRFHLRPLDPLPAIAIGTLLYFVSICFSSNPFTRHMLPVYPFLVLFVLFRVVAPWTKRLPQNLRPAVAVLLFVFFLAYDTFATRPLLRSFADDPVPRAMAWVRANTAYEPRFPPFRNFRPVPSVRSRSIEGGGPDALTIVHSAWVGRLTGSWWLRPAPVDLRDVYHFDGTMGELRLWQEVMKGRAGDWRVIQAFGDDWPTPERFFQSLLGRGYDQFVTAGRVSVVARTSAVQQ